MKIRAVHTDGAVSELDNVEQLYFLEGSLEKIQTLYDPFKKLKEDFNEVCKQNKIRHGRTEVD